MKKLLILVIILLATRIGMTQGLGTMPYTYKAKEHVPVLISMFVAGAAEGFSDYLSFHYDGSHQFWQPDISWTNKYKNHDVAQGLTFKGRYFVFLTDGWHLLKAVNHTAVLCALTFKLTGNNKKKWYWYVFEAGTYYLANRAGFAIGYKLIKIK